MSMFDNLDVVEVEKHPPRFDVIYGPDGIRLDYHFCREWDGEEGGCYGTNPNHGFSFDEAKEVIVSHYKNLVLGWETKTLEQWEKDNSNIPSAP
jgi:hypothetical protein